MSSRLHQEMVAEAVATGLAAMVADRVVAQVAAVVAASLGPCPPGRAKVEALAVVPHSAFDADQRLGLERLQEALKLHWVAHLILKGDRMRMNRRAL